jgi:precorrin-3B synthase
MEAADGLLVRVRLPGGSIAPSGLRTVAGVAEELGNRVVELTSRANLQIRGLEAEDIGGVAERLVRGELADADADADLRRDVVVSPLTGHDPTALIDLRRATGEIAELLAGADDLGGLPPKFGVVFDDGGTAPVRQVAADLGFGAIRAGDGDVMVQLELGRALDDAGLSVACIPVLEVPGVVMAGARLCAADGDRMDKLIERHGRAYLLATLTDGTAVRMEETPDPRPTVAPIGVLAAGGDRVNVGVAPLLGRSTPEMLRAVADVADVADATIRITPWRGLVLLGVAVADSERVVEQLTGAGLSADPSDPAHLVSACAGLPGCSSSRADTLGAARDLLAGPTPITARVHLSGCEKRCGANAEVVLVADEHGSFGTRWQ